MEKIKAAIAKLETVRSKAPAAQQSAIDLALRMMGRAINGTDRAKYPDSYTYCANQIANNDEFNAPERKMANQIMARLLG